MSGLNNFTMQEVEMFWDSVADIYEQCNDDVGDIHYQRFIESLKFLELKPNSRILNVWSRTGMAVKFLKSKEGSLDITNAEISSRLIARAKARFPLERFDKVDLLSLPYPDNYFDEVLSLETLEHVSSPKAFLEQLRRVLKPRGRLLLSVPPETAEFSLRVYERFFKHHGEGPHKFLSSHKVKKFLAEENFRLLRHRGTLLFPVNCRLVRQLGECIISVFQKTFISEFGIRQFYLAEK
jgi:ubiquinone/menaquinone biosynthesis C-methylase UbiE